MSPSSPTPSSALSSASTPSISPQSNAELKDCTVRENAQINNKSIQSLVEVNCLKSDLNNIHHKLILRELASRFEKVIIHHLFPNAEPHIADAIKIRHLQDVERKGTFPGVFTQQVMTNWKSLQANFKGKYQFDIVDVIHVMRVLKTDGNNVAHKTAKGTYDTGSKADKTKMDYTISDLKDEILDYFFSDDKNVVKQKDSTRALLEIVEMDMGNSHSGMRMRNLRGN